MPLYRVVRVPAASARGTRTDDSTAPETTVWRNLLRFTGVTILLAACACTSAPREQTNRSSEAVKTTLEVLGSWLVPYPESDISVTPEPTPWWTTAASMKRETAASRATVRMYFDRLIDTRALPPPFVDALVEYAARRAVSKMVDRKYLAFYLGRQEGRYFGGFVPRDLRVQIPVEGGADRVLQMLYTLERWVGRPVFDSILLEFITASTGRQPTLEDFIATASNVSGQDLSWLFDEGLRKSGRFDYAIESFESRPEAGAFRTTVTVRRLGDAIVPRSIPVVVTFADGEIARDSFDGRSDRMTFEYRSAAPAATASVDPDAVLQLDQNRRNNGMSLDDSLAATAGNRWSARWMIWLQDALLTYVALT